MSTNGDRDDPPMRREDAPPAAGDDLRAAPFTDHVFDDDYYGRSAKPGGKRSYGLILGIVFGIAIAGGVGFFAFGPSGPLTSSGEPPVIQADPTPYKTKPDDPGGMQVPNQDKLVYERVAKGDAAPQVENLLPPAEEPREPPASPTPETQPAIENSRETAPPASESGEEEVDPLAQAVAEIAEEGGQPVSLVPNSQSSPSQTAPSPVQTSPETVQSPQQTASVTIPDDAFMVQLAAARSSEGAESEWEKLSGQHDELLGGLNHVVLRADLGDRGVFYRLRVGPLDDRPAAENLCEALAAKNVGCIVIRP